MIAEKPSWIRHGGTQIFSIDIQPGGLRFATGGGDHKVRIWNMKSVGRELQTDDSASNLLATLRDHFGSVNCVRWAKHGRYIASGSDDQVILVHERKPGSGTTEFGSGEPPDVENWKVAMTLRGHTADVVDLNWSPDDSTLASGSLDNTIHVWDMSNGICTAVLRGHSSLVKGVAWDPIGSFIASQSDDKTVIIWRTSDWSLAHRTDGHWAKSLGSTFFRRLDWSPCGHFITTTHGFQKPRHSAPVLERGEWSATFDFLGHNAPIIVAKFNHSMFRRNPSNSQDLKTSLVGWSNGSSKAEGKELQPYNVIAIGSQDRTITVWTTASPRPLFVAKHFFTQSVVDLTWSPDGYSVFACSLDGTVATFHFDVNEIGYKLTDAELDDLKTNRYGDVRGRQGNLAETPAQLLLEAASAKETLSKKTNTVVPESQASLKPPADLGVTTKNNKTVIVNDGKKADESISDVSNNVVSARMSSPVKQKEYRRPDGRKRIIPEAVGVTAHQERTSVGAHSEGLEFPVKSLDRNKDNNGAIHTDNGTREGSIRKVIGGSADQRERSGATARASISENLVIEKVPASGSKEPSSNVEQIGHVPSGSILSIRVFDKKQGEDTVPVCLEARPREHTVNDIVRAGNTFMIKETELSCTRGSQNLWSDRISGKVTVLSGNSNFWAVGCEDGSLQVYTRCGRRAMPTMMMGSAAVFIDCDECWKLLRPSSVRRLLGPCLATSGGGEGRQMRRMVSYFVSPDAFTRLYIKTMDLVSQHHINTHWLGKEEVKVFPTIKLYTFELACRLFMSLEDEEKIGNLAKLFNVFLKGIISIPINLPGSRFYRAKKATSAIKDQLQKLVRERRAALEHKTALPCQDLLSHLLATPDENGSFMPESVIVNNILMLLFAGHDTSSVAITMLLKNLAQLPHVYDRVLREQQEIASAKGEGEFLQWEDVQKMRYSWSVVCETMRLWPPVIGAFREALTHISYAGYDIPKGWKLYWSSSCTHTDPSLYTSYATFDPSRFEEVGPAPFSYVAFGGGPRMCLGKEFARLEILIFLHNVITRFRWQLVNPHEKIAYDPMPTPVEGLPILLHPHI